MPEGSPFEDFFRDFMVPEGEGGNEAQRQQALGSGFVISADGFIVTNNHVIDGADEIEIEFFDKTRLKATLVGRDPKTDIALLKVESDAELPFVSFGDSDTMRVGDGVLFYHSSCAEPGIVGLAQVASTPYPDPTQFDPASPYFDPKSLPESPRWLLVDVQVLQKTRNLTLPELRADPELTEMLLLKRGNRLSITPVEPAHWRHITARLAA